MMMQRRRSDQGETADETLDRRIAEVQVERQRARSVPLRTEDGPGVRRLELVALGPWEETQPCGRGVPQALGPHAVASWSGAAAADEARWRRDAETFGGWSVSMGDIPICGRCSWHSAACIGTISWRPWTPSGTSRGSFCSTSSTRSTCLTSQRQRSWRCCSGWRTS